MDHRDLTGLWAAVAGHGRALRGLSSQLVAGLQAHNLMVGGALQQAVEGEHEEPEAWDLVNIDGGDRVSLAYKSLAPDVCGWAFHDAAFETERRWLNAKHFDVVFLEAARLEARHLGHWPAIEAAIAAPDCLPLIFLRPRALAALVLDMPEPCAALEIPCEDGAEAPFLGLVASFFETSDVASGA